MFSLRTLPARGVRIPQCRRNSLRQFSLLLGQPFRTPQSSTITSQTSRIPSPLFLVVSRRCYSKKSTADGIIERIQDQYATARDEFEIASEETEKVTVYAQADREAAREELDKLKDMYEEALKGSDGEEIKSRVGGRIRELDNAVQALEESVKEH